MTLCCISYQIVFKCHYIIYIVYKIWSVFVVYETIGSQHSKVHLLGFNRITKSFTLVTQDCEMWLESLSLTFTSEFWLVMAFLYQVALYLSRYKWYWFTFFFFGLYRELPLTTDLTNNSLQIYDYFTVSHLVCLFKYKKHCWVSECFVFFGFVSFIQVKNATAQSECYVFLQ